MTLVILELSINGLTSRDARIRLWFASPVRFARFVALR